MTRLCDWLNATTLDQPTGWTNVFQFLQVVNILPYERFDQFQSLMANYPAMLSAVDIHNCPCSLFMDLSCPQTKSYVLVEEDEEKGLARAVCLWPVYHSDVREVMSKGEYRGIPMGQLVEDPTRTRAGQEVAAGNMLLDREGIVRITNQRAQDVVEFLESGLGEVVYNAHDKLIITHVRTLTDLKSVMNQVSNFGAAHTASLQWRRFLEAGKFMEQGLVCRINVDELRAQFRQLYRSLEDLSKEKRALELGSLEIFAKFMSSKGLLFKDVEGVLSVMARAAVCTSVESIVETWVSTIEHHSPKGRALIQDRLEAETAVAINGPELVHADQLISQAMKIHFEKAKSVKERAGYFVRRKANVKQWIISEAVDSELKKPVKIAFMKE